MSMEDKKAAAIARGKRAELLLKDELVIESFETLKKDYYAGWVATSPRDTDGRERLWHAAQIIGKVQDHLRRVMSDGKLEQRELDDLAKPQNQRRFGIV